MNKLITIHGVRGYINENGIAQLNLEDISRGLGFVQSKDEKQYVRWETIDRYLIDLGFSHLAGKETIPACGHDGFIPENIFYRLAMKAKNGTAERFQTIIADEVLPAIRKTGGYIQAGREEEFIDKIFPVLSDETKKAMVNDLQKSVRAMKPKADYYDKLIKSEHLTCIRDAAKELGIKETDFIDWLIDKKFLYRKQTSQNKKGKLAPYAEFINVYFEIKDKKNEINGWTGTQTYINVNGKAYFRQRLLKEGLISA